MACLRTGLVAASICCFVGGGLLVGGGGSGGAAMVGSGGLSGGAPLGPPVPVMVGVVPVCAPRVRRTRLDDCFVVLMNGAVWRE